MATTTQSEPKQLLKALHDPQLKALLTELLKHVQHEQRQTTKDSGCG